jgi:hypothetical protein
MFNTYYTIVPQQSFQPGYYSWQPEAVVNNKIRSDSNITSNWKYRQYIQQNANQIMKYNTMESIYASGNNPYTISGVEQTNKNPYLYTSTHDTNHPNYGFINSDLKQNFITKQQIQAKMIAPSIPTTFYSTSVNLA